MADGYPIFNGLVTYVNEIKIGGDGIPAFNPPYERVETVTFPVNSDYTFLESKAGSDWKFNGNTTIELNGGDVSINNEGAINEGAIPSHGVIYVKDGNVEVSGILDGKLTIVSAGGTAGGNIEIVADITYQNPDIVPSETASNDMLGLIAEKDIIIPYVDSSPPDLFIDAIMISKEGSIWYEDWDSNSTMGGGGGGMVGKGVLTVKGSLIQKTDFGDVPGTGGKGKHFGYGWGMTDKDDKVKTGYYKKLNYDERLHYSQPPYFFKPDRSLYEITWRQS